MQLLNGLIRVSPREFIYVHISVVQWLKLIRKMLPLILSFSLPSGCPIYILLKIFMYAHVIVNDLDSSWKGALINKITQAVWKWCVSWCSLTLNFLFIFISAEYNFPIMQQSEGIRCSLFMDVSFMNNRNILMLEVTISVFYSFLSVIFTC